MVTSHRSHYHDQDAVFRGLIAHRIGIPLRSQQEVQQADPPEGRQRLLEYEHGNGQQHRHGHGGAYEQDGPGTPVDQISLSHTLTQSTGEASPLGTLLPGFASDRLFWSSH